MTQPRSAHHDPRGSRIDRRTTARKLLDAERGIYRFDELVVLRSATMPAVLLEAGVIVNRAEEARLRQPAYRQRIATAISTALRAYCAGMQP